MKKGVSLAPSGKAFLHMKVFISTLLVLVLLIGLMFLYTWALTTVSQNLLDAVGIIAARVEENDLDGAGRAYENYYEMFNKYERYIEILIDHGEIDPILVSNANARMYLKQQDTESLEAELSVLEAIYEHLPRKEALSWENIL